MLNYELFLGFQLCDVELLNFELFKLDYAGRFGDTEKMKIMIHIEGPIVDIQPEKRGVSRTGGEWRSREVVINHVMDLRYPKNMAVTFRGAQADIAGGLCEGETVGCDISIDAREWNGRWFNTVEGYNLRNL